MTVGVGTVSIFVSEGGVYANDSIKVKRLPKSRTVTFSFWPTLLKPTGMTHSIDESDSRSAEEHRVAPIHASASASCPPDGRNGSGKLEPNADPTSVMLLPADVPDGERDVS